MDGTFYNVLGGSGAFTVSSDPYLRGDWLRAYTGSCILESMELTKNTTKAPWRGGVAPYVVYRTYPFKTTQSSCIEFVAFSLLLLHFLNHMMVTLPGYTP